MNFVCGCHLLQSWGLVLAFSWGWPSVSNLTAPPFGVCGQETCQQPMCLPLSAPKSMRATPKQRTRQQSKVRTQIEPCTSRLECMQTFNCVVDVTALLMAFSILTICGGHPVRSKCILSWSILQVRVGACVVVKDGGKENVDPNATPMLARRPRMKKVVSEHEVVAHCTQIPSTRSKTSLKRTRKQEQLQACAGGGTLCPAHRGYYPSRER